MFTYYSNQNLNLSLVQVSSASSTYNGPISIVQNTTLGLKKMAGFFEFSVTEQDIESTIEKTSLKAMKEKGSEINRVAAKSLFRKGKVLIAFWLTLGVVNITTITTVSRTRTT